MRSQTPSSSARSPSSPSSSPGSRPSSMSVSTSTSISKLGPLSILLDSPVLLGTPWIHIFFVTMDCINPCDPWDVGEYMLHYVCQQWSLVAEEQPDEEQALFLRDALIIATLEDNPVRRQYFRGMRMRLQVAYAMMEMEALALGGTDCEYYTCC